MSRKSKQPRYKNKLPFSPSQADRLFDLVGQQVFPGPPMVDIRDPFKSSKLKQSIPFYRE